MDKADSHVPFDPPKKGIIDAHGGWWDATGDYGKHLSHLSFSTYFNPQQIPLVVYNLFKSTELLTRRGNPEFLRYKDHMLDEAMFGADYLVRVQVPDGSFYRSISNGGVNQLPEERKVAGEMKKFGIYQSADKEPRDMVEKANNDLEYEVSYRSGGGVAVAALAIASTFPFSEEFTNADYRKAAEDAFDFLEKNNLRLVNDGKENIVDDYCALTAATELYKATKNEKYKSVADKRAANLLARLATSGGYSNYWRADDATRPFFHASDAGLPAVSLLYYSEIASPETQGRVREVVRKSLEFQLALNSEVNNPFNYARQLTQDKDGNRHTAFFFTHNSEVAPWWQGENARLASLSAAASLASEQFRNDPAFQKKLQSFATDQLNWILGLNPFDSSMMNGVGRNNPAYMFFDSWEFTNAPGGISNGITSGFRDESDIDYNLTWHQTGADNDWRWQEQWLPHAAWYILAVSAQGHEIANLDWKAELMKAKAGIAKDPKSAFWHNQAGVAYDALGDFETARKEIKVAISLDPSNPGNYYTLYALYKRKSMKTEQRQVLLDALEQDPDNPLGHFEFAYILEEEKHLADSLREYQTAKRLAAIVKGQIYIDPRGNVTEVEGIREEADKAIERVTKELNSTPAYAPVPQALAESPETCH